MQREPTSMAEWSGTRRVACGLLVGLGVALAWPVAAATIRSPHGAGPAPSIPAAVAEVSESPAAPILDVAPRVRPIGNLIDSDADLVPDEFDNCVEIPNGPQQNSNQVDTDRDGYGNACDADYSGGPRDFEVTTADFAIFLYAFTGARPNPETDHDGDGETTASDMAIFLRQFQGEAPLGPGLPCAGMQSCMP